MSKGKNSCIETDKNSKNQLELEPDKKDILNLRKIRQFPKNLILINFIS